MTDHNVFQPIWTPEDARQTARDAAKHRGIPGSPMTAQDMEPDAPLPFRRNVKTICPSCSAWPLEVCEPGCMSLMTPEEQQQHREDVLDATIAELDRLEASPPILVTDCRQIGRHRVAARPRTRVARAVVAVVALALVLGVGSLWFASRAGAEAFDICPSGLSGVASADTSCAFADSVRAAFYWQPGWTVVATSPVTGKFYTLQCSRAVTDIWSWPYPKRCFGVNDAGAVLVVYVA